MNMQPRRYGIPSHQELSHTYDNNRGDPTYHTISSGHYPLSENTATFANRAYGDVSFNGGSYRPSSSAGNYPTNGFARNADMHSNSSGGYVITEQVNLPPKESPFTRKRWILIGCIVIIFLLIGGVTTATSLLMQPNAVSEIKDEACTRKCYSCSSRSSSSLCPKNGNIPNDPTYPLDECSCDTTCYSEIRSYNEYAVHRGCSKEFPNWVTLSRVNKSCQVIGTSHVCFCLGDRCNTHDMTVFPEYKYKD